ncbi:hypothetical protein [uncultured Desulfovibrio sp.]|uniref:hypothetical protein n=1 Tax=uncultured Desulfovibrio sp. TaxID=167968 RepID=UPI00261302FA|nr:hypothetical protein [uncultured Desulfovibrio sp.]
MVQARDNYAQLSVQEIEAIKVNQEIIKRMADNSQRTKNIFLSASAIFFALCGSKTIWVGWNTCLAFAIIAIVFWYIDAQYLRLERQFREHHKSIVDGCIGYLDGWRLNPNSYTVPSVFRIMFTFSEIIYPLMIVVMVLLVGIPLFSCASTGIVNPT